METIYKSKLVLILLMVISACGIRNENKTLVDGHWYVIYGEELMYGEAIYKDGKASFYSEEFGLRFRDYSITDDGILQIYDQGFLDNERLIKEVDINTITQTSLLGDRVGEPLTFHKIVDTDISISEILSQDSLEISKMMAAYAKRRAKYLSR